MTGMWPLCAAGAEPAPEERVAAYREFRAGFDSGDYAAALAPAARVVALTESSFGAESLEMANPLTNLATTHYRLQQYEMALDTYRRALEILELRGGPADLQRVPPLQGLAAALRGLQREPEAVGPLKQAVDITRNREGLRAPAQLPLLRALIASYVAAGRIEEAEREQANAFAIAEAANGKTDLRMIEELLRYARFKEDIGQHLPARVLYGRAADLAERTKPGTTAVVEPLRGIARSIRTAYVRGETYSEAAILPTNPSPIGQWEENTPSSYGEAALRAAIARLEPSTDPKDRATRGAVLTELGDWYVTADMGGRALATYIDAWQVLAQGGDTSSLARPTPVVYRSPDVSVNHHREDPELYTIEEIQVQLIIGKDGRVRDTTIANPSAGRDSAERALVSALRRSIWRPAIIDGQPVETTDYVHSELVYQRRAGTAD